MFVKSTRFKQVCQLLLSLIAGVSLIECGVSNLTKHINKLVPCSNIVTTDAKNDRLPCFRDVTTL